MLVCSRCSVWGPKGRLWARKRPPNTLRLSACKERWAATKKVSAVPEQVLNTLCWSWGLSWESYIPAVRTGASQGAPHTLTPCATRWNWGQEAVLAHPQERVRRSP